MEEYILNNLDILKINRRHRLYYGGSQEWFFNFFKKQAGCGPTTATNLFIYLAKTDDYFKNLFQDEINYDNVLKMMHQVWKDITPGMMGVNRVDILENGAQKYAKGHDVTINTLSFTVEPYKSNEHDIKDFLVEQLSHNRPVAFLNLSSDEDSPADSLSQ